MDAAGRDYHLAATDLGAKGFGANLSADPTYPFAVDFDGLTRTVPWDIGATIFVAGGGYTGQDVIGHIRILFRSP